MAHTYTGRHCRLCGGPVAGYKSDPVCFLCLAKEAPGKPLSAAVARGGFKDKRTCLVCGDDYLVDPGNFHQRYCSKSCAAQARWIDKKAREGHLIRETYEMHR